MNNNIKYIELVFENCESIIIPLSHFQTFYLGELTKVENDPWERDNVYRSNETLLEITYANQSDLVYNHEEYDEPLGMFINNPTSNRVEDRPNILGRVLHGKDIVCIDLLDGMEKEIESIYVPWHENDEYSNRYMKTEIKENVLSISISE